MSGVGTVTNYIGPTVASYGVQVLGGDEKAQGAAGAAVSAAVGSVGGVATYGVQALGGDETAQNATGLAVSLATENYPAAVWYAANLLIGLGEPGGLFNEADYPDLFPNGTAYVPPDEKEGHRIAGLLNEFQKGDWAWGLYNGFLSDALNKGLENANQFAREKVIMLTGIVPEPVAPRLPVSPEAQPWLEQGHGVERSELIASAERERQNRLNNLVNQGLTPPGAVAAMLAQDAAAIPLTPAQQTEYNNVFAPQGLPQEVFAASVAAMNAAAAAPPPPPINDGAVAFTSMG